VESERVKIGDELTTLKYGLGMLSLAIHELDLATQ
jgi:hypothetical protein